MTVPAFVHLDSAPEWLNELRQAAWSKASEMDWKRCPRSTNVSLTNVADRMDALATPGKVEAAQLERFLTGDECAKIVFVDGAFSAELSDLPSIDGLQIGPMTDAYEHGSTRHHFDSLSTSDDVLELLHCATFQDGAFILAEADVPGTIHILNVTTGGNFRSMHHVVVASGANVRVLESHVHLADNEGTTLSFTAIVASDNAHVDHIKVQKEDQRALHLASQRTFSMQDATIRSTHIDIGADQSRQAMTSSLVGSNSEVDLQGAFFGQRSQRKDVWTRVEHTVPHARSNEVFKGIMDDSSRGAFTGLVKVHEGAHHSESEQENRNLLLSRKAHVDASPQLEIDNDDVRASHGSTIGQLEEEQLFFLQSRGISREKARTMLTRAFASDILEGCDGHIRQLLDKYLHIWFIQHQEHLR